MHAHSGRYVIAYNGEIYNHTELRAELEVGGHAPPWRGHSDTETLLACMEAWGIENTVRRAVGMFALALWDREERVLTLVRDRLGEKPMYYGWQGSGSGRTFLFGSELKALRTHPSFEGEVDRGSVCMLLRHNCVPAPWSIYRGIYKLPPACLLTVSPKNPEPVVRPYWSLFEAARAARANPFTGTPEQAVDELEQHLGKAVLGQMVADVPLGAFLSGGIDSSTVVALMQARSSRPVKTFTIGFNEHRYDEAAHAKLVARHLGTDHTELYVSPQQALDVIPRLPELYCEPFADSSQIPTFLVSKLARSRVTVSLSGDAGDELLAGYNRYMVTAGAWRRLKLVPKSLRRAAAHALTAVSPSTWDRWARVVPTGSRFTAFGDKVHKSASVLAVNSDAELYTGLVSHHKRPESWVKSAREHRSSVAWDDPALAEHGTVERMMAFDTVTYLPDDILVKVDRAAMAVSLETRVPFLDHRVVEFAWRLPLSYKLREGVTKWPLRQLLYRFVPRELVERPKSGFGVPIDSWLRGPLRDWASALLDEGRLNREGYFNAALVRTAWAEHLSGRKNLAYQIWDILMFQAWLEHERGA
jgi:asparagine synthase (glutamine-hydrolysing)